MVFLFLKRCKDFPSVVAKKFMDFLIAVDETEKEKLVDQYRCTSF